MSSPEETERPGGEAGEAGSGGHAHDTGGQAVIEGVMMRSPERTSVAVRRPDGEILVRELRMKLLGKRGPLWKRPVFRGAASLIDTLRLGMSALQWSAEVAEGGDGSERAGFGSILQTALAFLLAIALFAWLPLQASKWILGSDAPGQQFYVHLLAGGFRILAFLAYLTAISFMPEVKRLFTYHGAEHQTIHAWERGGEPLIDAALEESPLHQRCGTSFLLLVMLGTVVFYGVFDSLVVLLLDTDPAAIVRVLYHLPLIPLVLGLSYELLKAADRHLDTSFLARAVTAPGLLLQRITTRRAGREEVEVAVASLRAALGMPQDEDVRTLEPEEVRPVGASEPEAEPEGEEEGEEVPRGGAEPGGA